MSFEFSLTTFSPTGKLLQIEYALKAVNKGKPALGIRATNGVVIATDKKIPTELIDDSAYHKIQNITDQSGMVYAGMGPDFRVLVRKARKNAQAYYRVYHEHQPMNQVVRDTADLMQECTQAGGVRQFGVSVLTCGYDDNGPQLYQIDPSGISLEWKATAIGKNFVNAKTFLEKRYNENMELEDAIHVALLTLKESFEGEMTEDNIEIGIIGDQTDRKFKILTPAEIKDYLSEAL